MRDNQAGPPVTYAVVPRPPTAAVEWWPPFRLTVDWVAAAIVAIAIAVIVGFG